MIDVTQNAPPDPLIRTAGWLAILSGIIATIGLLPFVFLTPLPMPAFVTQLKTLSGRLWLNDICAAIQYLLAIPIALALFRILLPHNPAVIRIATIVGIAAMLTVAALQLLLVLRVVTYRQQVVWLAPALIVGVGSWLVSTGLVARSTGRLPNSLVISVVAVPYFGYPLWAFWLGRHLIGW